MAEIFIPLRPKYRDAWETKWTNMRPEYESPIWNYISLSLDPGMWDKSKLPDGTAARVGASLDVAFVDTGWNLSGWGKDVLRINIFLPDFPPYWPSYIQLFSNGYIAFQKDVRWGEPVWYQKIWDSFWANPVAKFYTFSWLFDKVREIGEIASVMEVYNWYKTNYEYIKQEMLEKYYNLYWKFEIALEPYLKPLKSWRDTIVNPFIESTREALTTVNTRVNKAQGDIETLNTNLTKPFKEISDTIYKTNGELQRNFLKNIDVVARGMELFGWKAGREWEKKGEAIFNSIGDWVTDATEPIRRYRLYVQNELDKFIREKYTPIKDRFELVEKIVAAPTIETAIRLVPDMAKIKPLVEAVILIENELEPENARLRANTLQKTLGSYPVTLIHSIDQATGFHHPEKVAWLEKKINVLPEVDWWEQALAKSDHSIYVDSKGNPLDPEPSDARKAADEEAKLPWETVDVMKAIREPDVSKINDIHSTIRLYDKGVEQGEVPDAVIATEAEQALTYLVFQALGTIFIKFSWLAFLDYEYSLAAVQYALYEPDTQKEIIDFEKGVEQDFWDSIDFWGKFIPAPGQPMTPY